MSVEQMKAMGMTNVMIGHSERRGEFGIFKMDDDTTLATKLKYVLDAGMTCVYCIGEPKEVREKGLDAVMSLMDTQLQQIYGLLDPVKVVIAYEPVWAIGTGLTATPADAQATHKGIRELIAKNASASVAEGIRIQYGGSANAKNAPELSAQPDIDGFLVGGASLKPEFVDIVKAISDVKGKTAPETNLFDSRGSAAVAIDLCTVAPSSRPFEFRNEKGRKPIVGGNWKCNPDNISKLPDLIANIEACDTSKCDVYFCPTPLHVPSCIGKVTNGAMVTPQNCNFKGCGAFTGEMSVEQMKAMGMTNVMIGHSERRGEFGIFKMDDDTTLATKLKYVLDAGMTCVYCIGEPKEVREKGLDAVMSLMDTQLKQIYGLLDPVKVVIAYEPVWAIGTGLTATPADAQATHKGIRDLIAKNASASVADGIRIQYGGSANAKNAPELSAQPDIDGFLVGGASLKPEFADIVKAISDVKGAAAPAPGMKIAAIRAREIFDSRGNPTVEVDLCTETALFRAAVPSGASTGVYEALELRDGDKSRLLGKGVLKAVDNVNNIIGPKLVGMDVTQQKQIDDLMVQTLDGTTNEWGWSKSKLGANSILAVSMAVCRAGAASSQLPLYQYIAKLGGKPQDNFVMPVPCLNVINGGSHAGNRLACQEFMIVPTGASNFKNAMCIGAEVYHTLKGVIKKKYGQDACNVGDEGGFAPSVQDNDEALDILMEAIEKSGHKDKIKLATDVAASEFYNAETKKYDLDFKNPSSPDSMKKSAEELIEYYKAWLSKYPLVSIEDPFDQDDWDAYKKFMDAVGKDVQVVGDDLLVTNPKRIQKGMEVGACNALLCKVNQIGSVTESIEAVTMCQKAGWGVMVSHRSGETEDTFIADLVVGMRAGEIKTGAPCRSERLAKYNQLIRIEEELGPLASYAGASFRAP